MADDAIKQVDWQSELALHPSGVVQHYETVDSVDKLLQDLVGSASLIASRAGTSVISPAHIK